MHHARLLARALSRPSVHVALLAAAAITTGALEAAEKGSEQVSPFYGSFSYAVPIEVPPFHGLEPRLALAYSSEARNGFVGVGWTLAGLSTVERANSGRGLPRFVGTDIYLLDGQELVDCAAGGSGPSCTSGGTHSTKIESFLKIRQDSALQDTGEPAAQPVTLTAPEHHRAVPRHAAGLRATAVPSRLPLRRWRRLAD